MDRYREQDRSSIVESGGPPATTTPRPGREFNNPITPNAWSMGTQWQPTSFQATGHLNEDTRIPRNSPRDTSAVKLTQQVWLSSKPAMTQVDNVEELTWKMARSYSN